MFSAIFAATRSCACDRRRSTGAQLFNQGSVAIETACLLASSYTCGLMALAIGSRRDIATYLAALITFALGAVFLALEIGEFADMIAMARARNAAHFSRRSSLLSAVTECTSPPGWSG